MIGLGSDKKEDKEEYSPASGLPRPSVHLAGKAALGGEELWLVFVVGFFRPPLSFCHMEQGREEKLGIR